MADDVNVEIKSTYDGKGAREAEASIAGVADAAKRAEAGMVSVSKVAKDAGNAIAESEGLVSESGQRGLALIEGQTEALRKLRDARIDAANAVDADFQYQPPDVVKIGIEEDGDGSEKLGAAMDGLSEKARNLGRRNSDSGRETSRAFGAMSAAAGGFRRVLGALGAASFGSAIIAGIGKIAESFRSAEKNASDFAKIERELAEKSSLKKMAADANALADASARAAEAAKTRLSVIDEEVAARRRLEKARLEAAKEDELAKLDSGAEDYGEQVAAIEAKYSRLTGQADASNAREDIVLRRQKIDSDIAQNRGDIEAESSYAALLEEKIRRAQKAKDMADIQSKSLNELDKGGVIDALGKTFNQLVTGDWGRANKATTAEGDAERKRNKEKSAEYALQILDLQEELHKSNARLKALRRKGTGLQDSRKSTDTLLEASEVERDTAESNGRRVQEEAVKKLTDKQDAIAKDEDDRQQALKAVSEGNARLQELSRRKAELEAQKAASEDRIAQAKLNAEYGQYGGGSEEAQSVARTAKMVERRERNVLKSIAETLQTINEDMKEVAASVRKNESRAKIRSDED